MTREDVKRQFTQYSACDPRECSKCADDALDRAVDEVVRLRAKLAGAQADLAAVRKVLKSAQPVWYKSGTGNWYKSPEQEPPRAAAKGEG